MRGDKRRAKRHRMQRKAWLLVEGGERSECTVTDISDKGAHFNVPDSDGFPDTFMLLLAENGSTRRRCRVIWRKPRELGVKFESRLDERIRANGKPLQTVDKKLKIAEDV